MSYYNPRRYHLKVKYNITEADYDAMLAKQDGKCAVCHQPPKKTRRLAVDHNHKTGYVRGLLCFSCNYGIGVFNDDPARLLSASKYLRAELLKARG